MRKIMTPALLCLLLLAGNKVISQSKTGCISFSELLAAMPESKKADSLLGVYRDSLAQQFEAFKAEFTEQQRMLSSPDTTKYSKAQLDVKKQNFTQLYYKLQGYEQEAGQLLDQKRQALLAPIQKKAADAIDLVAKENGYGFIIEKDALHTYPPSDDILPLVRKKLAIAGRPGAPGAKTGN